MIRKDVQRGWVTCPWSHSEGAVEPALEPKTVTPRQPLSIQSWEDSEPGWAWVSLCKTELKQPLGADAMRKVKPQKGNSEGLGVTAGGAGAVPLSPEDWETAVQSSDCRSGSLGQPLGSRGSL